MFRTLRQNYTEEFKREAVKLLENGMKAAIVVRQLGIKEQRVILYRATRSSRSSQHQEGWLHNAPRLFGLTKKLAA